MDDRLELQMTSNFTKVAQSIKEINTALSSTNSMIKTTKVSLDSMGNIKSINATIKDTTTQATKAGKAIKTMFDVGKFYAFWNVTKRIRDTIFGWIKSSIDFIETTNKFEVSMGNMSKSANDFQNRLSEAFGTSRTEMMDFQANFNNILKSLPGLAEETSYALSETLTALALDYSSMFNVNTAAAMEKVQDALVGNVKSIRSTSGFDITEATIADLAASLGVEKSVRNMSQMEKRLLRIISLMNQMKATGAMQDLARTIEQPANQIRVLQSQLQELGVWLGNVFIGTLGKILPYINGFVMALKEIIKVLAIFVGYDGAGSIADPIQVGEQASSGIASNLGSASKSAKEIKKSLMGFDVLNVIQSPSDTSGGGGAGGVGPIDPAILNALSQYDSMMADVRTKATDIRNRILEWLGFTLELDEKGRLIGIHLKDGYTNLEKIRDVIKIIGTIVAGWTILKVLDKIAKFVLTFTTFKGFAAAFPALSEAISKIGTAITAFGWDKLILLLTKALAIIVGIVSTISGAIGYIKNLKEKTIDISKALENVIKIVTGIGIAVASVFGAIPGLFAALIAAVGTLIYTLVTKWDEFVAGLKYLLTKLGDWIIEKWTKLGDAIIAGFNWIMEKWKALGDFIVEKWTKLGDWIVGTSKSIFNGVSQWFTKEKWSGIFSNIKTSFQDTWNSIKNWFSKFDLGKLKTPHFTWTTTPATGWVKKVLEALNIPASLPKLNVSWYAQGGLPNVGEMFVAREAGPELVGKIGNSNAVMNNNQIVESVSRGVAEAVSGVMGRAGGGSYNFYLDGKELTATVVERMRREANISGMGVY